MKIITNVEEHYDCIEKMLDSSPDSVFISTYGIYAGLLHDGRDANLFGPKYKTRSIDVLKKMSSIKNAKVIIGLTEFNSCKPYCDECEMKYIHNLLRIKNHADAFPSINFKMIRHNHLKCFIINKGGKYLGITGGRNLSDSSWHDISFILGNDDCIKILEYAETVYESGVFITDDTIAKFANEQGISVIL